MIDEQKCGIQTSCAGLFSTNTLFYCLCPRYCRCEFKLPIVVEPNRVGQAQTIVMEDDLLVITAYSKVKEDSHASCLSSSTSFFLSSYSFCFCLSSFYIIPSSSSFLSIKFPFHFAIQSLAVSTSLSVSLALIVLTPPTSLSFCL